MATESIKNAISCQSYSEFFSQFRSVATQYADLPMDSLYGAYSKAYANMPMIQNNRVKHISSYPVDYNRSEVADMLRDAGGNEKPLREVAEALVWTAYPFRKITKEYQDLLTYHWYIQPKYLEDGDEKKDDFWRDWRIAYKLAEEIRPAELAHMAAGQAGREGKVFYTVQKSVDKTHSAVSYAFAQQLPQDWCKIIGFNNKSKYTVSFDMMYFMQPGTDWRQFGDLFAPYVSDFADSARPQGRGKVVFGSVRENAAGNPDVFEQNGRWFYWVSLPPERVWCFEIDDVDRVVASPFTGLMLSMADVAQYEDIQINLTQNPLVSMVTGEIPYRDDNGATNEDSYKLSPAGRKFFENLFYQMLAATDTTGIGIYAAPFENIKLQQLSEAPNATSIAADGYSFAIAKAGLSAILPTDSEARAAMATVSFMIESQFAKRIYDCTERMMNSLIRSIGLRYDFEFKMFGSLAEDEQMRKEMRESMTLGILPDTMMYNALRGRSIFDDLSASAAIMESGVLDKRIPLVSSYSAKQGESRLPPQPGRPRSEGITSEGQEQDLDQGK